MRDVRGVPASPGHGVPASPGHGVPASPGHDGLNRPHARVYNLYMIGNKTRALHSTLVQFTLVHHLSDQTVVLEAKTNLCGISFFYHRDFLPSFLEFQITGRLLLVEDDTYLIEFVI